MTNPLHFIPILMLMATVACAAAMQQVCEKALPSIVQTQTLAADASDSVERASSLMGVAPLTSEQRRELEADIKKAREALYKVHEIAASAAAACTAIDIAASFDSFIIAWESIRAIIGIVSTGGLMKATPDGASPVVPDPIVYRMLRGADAGKK